MTTTRTTFRAEGFTCPSCVAKLEKQVGHVPGVFDVTVRFASGRVEVDHDPHVASSDAIIAAIAKTGYRATAASL